MGGLVMIFDLNLKNSRLFYPQVINRSISLKGVSVDICLSRYKELQRRKIHHAFAALSPADFVSSLSTDDEVSAFYMPFTQDIGGYHSERVLQIRRVSKVVKGGKQMSFCAVVVGGTPGKVGVGVAAAKEVVGAVAKAVNDAKTN